MWRIPVFIMSHIWRLYPGTWNQKHAFRMRHCKHWMEWHYGDAGPRMPDGYTYEQRGIKYDKSLRDDSCKWCRISRNSKFWQLFIPHSYENQYEVIDHYKRKYHDYKLLLSCGHYIKTESSLHWSKMMKEEYSCWTCTPPVEDIPDDQEDPPPLYFKPIIMEQLT